MNTWINAFGQHFINIEQKHYSKDIEKGVHLRPNFWSVLEQMYLIMMLLTDMLGYETTYSRNKYQYSIINL